MKKLFDKIIIIIFYLLCLFAFVNLVYELPKAVVYFFNLDASLSDDITISFFFCTFILGYAIQYFSKGKESEFELSNPKYKILGELSTVYNLNNLDCSNLGLISKIEYTSLGKFLVKLKNGISFQIDLNFYNIFETQKTLEELDSFLVSYTGAIDIKKESILLQFDYERAVAEYSENIKK